MAIFGAPVSQGDDTLNAARCALRLVAVRQELNQTSKHKIQVGIGVATGTVVAGCMGSADRLNYTVLGDRVNLGSRLCDKARAGEVLIDETTKQKLDNAIIVEATGDWAKVSALIELLKPLGIREIVRTGTVAITRLSERNAAQDVDQELGEEELTV